MAVLLEQPESLDHVVGGERRAVGKACLGPQREDGVALVVGDIDRRGDEAVHGIGLVGGADHQRIEQEIETLGGVAAQDVAIEAVKGVDARGADGGDAAASRRVRIDIVEMVEAGWIFKLAENRPAMSRLGEPRARAEHQCRQCGGGKSQASHVFPPIAAALAASHHQMVGNATA